MKISLEWLKDFVGGELAAEAVADSLMRGGLPVEVIERHGDDHVLDVEVTSNRGDCLSHIGVGREVAALQKKPFRQKPIAADETGPAVSEVTSVKIEAAALCPMYTA